MKKVVFVLLMWSGLANQVFANPNPICQVNTGSFVYDSKSLVGKTAVIINPGVRIEKNVIVPFSSIVDEDAYRICRAYGYQSGIIGELIYSFDTRLAKLDEDGSLKSIYFCSSYNCAKVTVITCQ
jgi:hypothetical protein